MRKHTTILVSALLSATAVCLLLGVTRQTNARLTDELGNLLIELQNNVPTSRAEAFYRLLQLGSERDIRGHTNEIPYALARLYGKNPERSDEIKMALIRLLERENNFVHAQKQEYKQSGQTLSEAYVDYYGDLIASVSSLKDQRALKGLMGAIGTGNMATKGLARLGSTSVYEVVGKLNDADPITRLAAARVLLQMLEPENARNIRDAAAREQIKQGLLAAVNDTDPSLRLTGVEGLGALGDRSVIPILEKLALSDRFEGFGEEHPYPVRDAAKKALDRLRQ